MKKIALGSLVLLALIGLSGVLTSAWAQEVTAAIVGTVTDSSGAPIKGATVTATDTERGTVWTAQTNDTGAYNLLRLPVGNYTVKVSVEGFQSAQQSDLTLVLNQTARVDVQMKVGKVSETVEVTSARPALQTESTEVSTILEANTLESVPLAARNYIQLTLLSPGATTVNPESLQLPQNMLNSGRPYINGNREQANSFLLDGQLNNETKNNEVAYNPGLDAIQEFNLITQNASAEFGNYQGGVINASIKSGTNSYHGELFEYFRNDAINANKYWNGMTEAITGVGVLPKNAFRYNQFGGTFGGPIVKNKLFFFVDYQGQRRKNINGQTGAQLLTSSERAGDFGDLCTTGFTGGICNASTSQLAIQLKDPVTQNPIPNNNLAAAGYTISPVAQSLFNSSAYPLPQLDSTAIGNNTFFGSGDTLSNDQGDLKIDYAISDKDHVYGRWSQMNLRDPNYTTLTLFAPGGLQSDPIRNAVINWTHVFNSSLLNEFRIGFGAVHFDAQGTDTDSLGNFADQLGITNGNSQAAGMLQLQIPGVAGGNPTLGSTGAVQIFHTTEGQIGDNLIYTHGRHSTKFGFQYWRERQDYNYGGNNGTLGFLSVNSQTGAGLADFWLGNVGGGFRDGSSNTVFGLRGNIFGVYVQDDWRITNTLTLNLGLRFEDHTPFYEVKDREVNFGLLTGTIYTPDGRDGTTKYSNRALYDNYLGKADWNPRFGFAWSPAALGGKTVIRGGYAISQYMEGSGANEALTQNPPFFGATESPSATGVGTLGAGFASSVSPCAPNPDFSFACYAGKRIRMTDQHFRPAVTQQWNLTLQHQISNSLTFQLGYVGQHGTHLLNFADLTQLVGLNASGTLARPGEPIVSRVAGPYLGGGAAGSLYAADNAALGGVSNIAGANMSNSNQRYDALQAVLQKRMSNGLQAQVAYTFSKCLSNSPGYFGTGWGSSNALSSGGQPGWQNTYDGRADWGPCYFDQTHIVTSYVTYQLPFGRGKQFGHDMNPALSAVVGNWEIGGIVTLHTGNALTLNEFGGWGAFNGDPSNTNGIGAYFLSARPNCSSSLQTVDKYVAGDGVNPGSIRWFDTTNVTHPSNEFGNCSVGNGRGPGLASFDLNLHKDVTITERLRMEFRLEAINAFNHRVLTFSGGPAGGSFDPGTPVFDPIDPNRPSLNTSNSNFGNITGSQGARQLQLALKFMF